MNQTNLREIKIAGKSDRLIVWDDNLFDAFEKWRKEKNDCQYSSLFYQFEVKPYDPQTERLWIYANQPENKLKYLFEINKKSLRPGELPDDSCDSQLCCCLRWNFNIRLETYKERKILEYAYELTLLHEFKKGNSLLELQKYKHEKSGKYLFVPQPTRSHIYVSSYPELVKDIIVGKIS